MAGVLHLLRQGHAVLASTVIEAQVTAGDRVTVAWLPEAPPPGFPPNVVVRHLHRDLTYPQLLDLVLDADHVIAW